ncbi:inorganic phosphate transporter [Pontibaca methylaminivorans]|uniref:Phosphate transporter n=1 Tax=Pontibaca methylaminivorans TaxID=515897 RepID=A0A1R3XBQ3_9RHOB|nr:inorganic phosphate transporter [Pontibaca methylaminivorans]SIT86969.1 inorganic phosphate transporter, PiT family [Pontibaca methylaminivorans]
MSERPAGTRWKTLDSDLNRISIVEYASAQISRPLVAPGIGLAFIAVASLLAAVFFGHAPVNFVVVAAAGFGAYMALNIGANDVANNMGPAVGANALSMTAALVIAAVFESAGALLAGGDVVTTISQGIVAPSAMRSQDVFIWAMMAALISSALWVNLATWIGAPVSTTHAVVGGVVGAGAAAAGIAAVNWAMIGTIAASWVISPVLGGGIAAALLAFINARIIYREDKVAAARVWVPVLVGVMAGTFATYMLLKGLSRLVTTGPGLAAGVGIGFGIVIWLLTIPLIRRRSQGLENRESALRGLFGLPLVISAALLSFAHGANDVANAVGPLAAIVHAVGSGGHGEGMVLIPNWVMVIGAFGISFGLFLFGPRLINMVGNEITKLNPIRAFCVALSAAFTVIVASWLGLPVSSTHIAIGGVFGVGFFREWLMERRLRHMGHGPPKPITIAREERARRRLVRRSHFMTILAAWVITVPAAALISAAIFLGLRTVLG